MAAIGPTWRDDVAECFSKGDQIFAAPHMNDTCALELLKRLNTEAVPWPIFKSAVSMLLRSRHCGTAHAAAQMENIEARFRYWLPE